jgi:hypothetical protein
MSLLPKGRTLRQPSQEPTFATVRFGSVSGPSVEAIGEPIRVRAARSWRLEGNQYPRSARDPSIALGGFRAKPAGG